MNAPFKYGTVANGDDFTNRVKETERLVRNFNSGINTILISPRRWGKSSLVKYVADQKGLNSKIRVCYIDLFNTRTESEFYATLSKQVIKASDAKWRSKLKELGKFFKQVIPVFNVSSDPNTDLSISLNWEEVKKHPSDILNLAEQICEERKIKMVICMDEFQDIQFYDDPVSFQKKLRSHWQHHKNVTYCLYGSKRHMMMDIFNNSSMPFYRFGDLMFLNKIEKQEWIDFIHKRFKDTGKEISLENAEEIALLMDGHPFFVQQLSQQAWFLTQKKCTSEIIDEAARYLLQQYHFLFQKEVDQLTNPQINFLKAILDDTEQFTSSEVLKKYKLGTAGNVKRIREALENKEIIDTSEQRMNFQDPIFKLWLKRVFFEEKFANNSLSSMNEDEAKIVSVLCQAIRKKRRVKFFYVNTGTKKSEWRTIEPYLIGIRKHNQNIFLTGYDLSTEGESVLDKNLGQKQFLIDRIDSESIQVLKKTFKIIRVPKERIENTPTIDVICKVSFEGE